EFNSKTAIDFYKIGAYGHVSKYFLDGKCLISAGARTDINTFTNDGNNPLKAFSPRISFAYNFNPEWNVSASVGSYYKIPSYTMLGFVDEEGNLKNKDLKYINAIRSEEHTSELQSRENLVCRLLLEKKKKNKQ